MPSNSKGSKRASHAEQASAAEEASRTKTNKRKRQEAAAAAADEEEPDQTATSEPAVKKAKVKRRNLEHLGGIWSFRDNVELEMPRNGLSYRPFDSAAPAIWRKYNEGFAKLKEDFLMKQEAKVAAARAEKEARKETARAEREAKKAERQAKKSHQEAAKTKKAQSRSAKSRSNEKAAVRAPSRASRIHASNHTGADDFGAFGVDDDLDLDLEDEGENSGPPEPVAPQPPAPASRKRTAALRDYSGGAGDDIVEDIDEDSGDSEDDEAEGQDKENQPAKRTHEDHNEDKGKAAGPACPAQAAPSPFLRLPFEIREGVYSLLLTAQGPIRVRKEWTCLSKAQARGHCGAGIQTAIMRTNRQISAECIPILYGNNVFEYELREAVDLSETRPEQERVDADDGDNDADDEDEEDDDDEYVEPAPRCRRSTQNGNRHGNRNNARQAAHQNACAPCSCDPDEHFNIVKFGHYFRHLRIVAKRDRSGPGYRERMAQVIAVFSKREPPRARLHTLTIEIAPQRIADGAGRRRGSELISFADFFYHGGSVVQELKGLPCQFVRIVVVSTEPAPPEEILLNQRWAASMRRSRRGERDLWKGDASMAQQRDRMAGRAQKKMTQLPRLIWSAWKNQNDGIQEGNEDDESEYENDDEHH